ncbi:hypothetical protein D3C72_1062640 [compost metagenome]
MAKPTVCAIGRNILPSTPTNVRMGMYTIRMMISPNAALVRMREAETKTSSSISCWLNFFTDLRNPRWCIVASTMITAPSTIKPKSIAPRLIRFALTPKTFIIPNAKSIASGMAEATISPARKFPRNSTSTKITINAPSIRFFSTVPIALPTRSVRSR